MRLATWNVNSVKARLPNVLEWLDEQKPDLLLLQELKCETAAFPALELEAKGYKILAVGQKTYNGVAVLSREPVEVVTMELEGDSSDTQARYLEIAYEGMRIASLYLPNGNPIDTEKFDYKLRWMKRLNERAQKLLQLEVPVILGGDFNVIPEAMDVYDPKGWEMDALFHPLTRASFRALIQLGYTEAFRALHPNKLHAYSFWDYQAGSWQRDAGLRIDHFLLSPEATDRLKSCFIDKTPRGKDKASDHTPVILEIS